MLSEPRTDPQEERPFATSDTLSKTLLKFR